MEGFIVSFIVGIICIVLGILNMSGNIKTLHSYHTSRVREEDKIPFGKAIGLGTIICGVTICAHSVMSAIALYAPNEALTLSGTITLIAGLVIGLAICIYALIKYNKGIF